MDRSIERQIDVQKYGKMRSLGGTEGKMGEWSDRQTDEWMVGRTEKRTNG